MGPGLFFGGFMSFLKNIYSSFLVIFTSCIVLQNFAAQPEDTVIAFDLHDVVFTKSTKKILKQFSHIHHTSQVISLVFNHHFWHDVKKIRKQTDVAEAVFYKLIKKYPALKKFEKDFINLTNDVQRAQKEVISLIKNLKKEGYTVILASNIGSKTFENLRKKQSELMNLFTAHFVAEAPDYIHKPQVAYFDKIKNKFSGKNIILVDDKRINIDGAKKAGLDGIQFKSASQLRLALKKKLALSL